MAAILDQQLVPILHGTLSSDPQHRSQSEALLDQVRNHEGYCSGLLKIASQADVDMAVRQVSSICLKNAVKRRWNPSPNTGDGKAKDQQPIPQADKANLMHNLHECVVRSPPLVQKQLLEVVREVASCDFPQPWSELLPAALQNIAGNDLSRIYGSLLALRSVASCLEFSPGTDVKLQEFSTAALPVLLQLVQRLLQESSDAAELAMMMKCILKVFWSCTYLSIPQVLLAQPALARQWLEVINALLKRPLPTAGQPDDPVAQEKAPWWKLRKWVLRIAIRMFERYGDPKIAKVESSRAFAALFLQEYSLEFLKSVLELVTAIGKGAWASRQVTCFLCKYLDEAVKQRHTAAHLSPFLLDILVHVALPLAFFSAAAAREWEEDPTEVIRKNSSALCMYTVEDMYDPRDAAVNFIMAVMKAPKQRDKLLDPFMEHVLTIMHAFRAQQDAAQQGAPAAAGDAVAAYQMDGAALVIGGLLERVLVKRPKYRGALEAMATQYLMPMFASAHPFLRAKACWLSGQYAAEVAFAQPDGSQAKGRGALFDQLFDLILQCMQDRDLPVQVEAVNAFRDFVEALSEADRLEEKLKPILKDLLRHLFHMTGMIEAMDVIMSVDTIVERIGDDIQPYAVDVCKELIAVYARVVNEQADDDEDALFDAGFHILSPIIKLLDACSDLPATMANLEELLTPLLHDMCSRNPEDVFEQICEMLSYFTYFAQPISARLWGMWPRLEGFLRTWGSDYVDNIVVPLDNFISRGTDHFCTCAAPNYRESVYGMVQYCLAGDFDETDVKPIAKLLDIVLLNCKGRVDEWVWPYLELVSDKLPRVRNASFATLLMNVVPAALVYDTGLTLRALETHGRTAAVFQLWFKMLQDESKFFRRIYDKKLCCVGLVCLLGQADAALPDILRGALPTMFQEVVKMLKRLKEQEVAAKAGLDDEDDDDDDDDSAEAHDGDDDDQEVDPLEEDAQYLAALERKRELLAGGGDDDEAVILDDWTDDEEVESALDATDPFDLLVTTMNGLQASMPERFQALTGSLDTGMKSTLQDIVQHAHIRKAEQSHSAAGTGFV